MAFHSALNEIWSVIGVANRYIDYQAPWKLSKTDTKKMGHVLYQTLEVIRKISILLQPFIPTSTSILLDQLSVPHDERTFEFLKNEYRLPSGRKLPQPKAIFPRYNIEK